MHFPSFRVPLPGFVRSSPFNAASRGGPRRVLIIAGTAVGMLALVVGASFIHHTEPAPSQTAKMPYINPLPGGTQSNPHQDALALRAAQEQASAAERSGHSYTPPMPASQPLKLVATQDPPATTAPDAQPHQPVVIPVPRPAAVAPAHAAPAAASVLPVDYNQPAAAPAPHATASQDPQVQQAYKTAINQLLASWNGSAPRTDIVVPLDGEGDGPNAGVRTGHTSATSPGTKPDDPATAEAKPGRLLIPAGRGIYAHTVLAVNSDTGGPLVLEADSGPIAGDRMTATFSKNGYDRLVVRVVSIAHKGRTLEANAIVIAPDTMETAVASSVDEHYMERFLLPAAAAFVQGLGQAISQSNTTSSVSSLTGTVTGVTKLHIGQEAGVAAGTAAQQVGSALAQEAPKGPTINLDANANVGIMFLGDLRDAE
jgi:intracellular multiplication protein IcmE